MIKPHWILEEVVLAIHKILLSDHGGLSGLRDRALLDSSLNRPKQLYTYQNQATIYDLAASYCYGLAKNHPFVDGNKRIALTTAVVFLEHNQIDFAASEAETVIIIESLAAGNISEQNLSLWFEKQSQKDTT
ncbi:MAG: type II toxin-antitoxin system death-on-curing family toxin [Enterobacterales bacterium]|nr:type II toxin-antitoxin system death-on-curing family toxin [Enterobacterales bacterium]